MSENFDVMKNKGLWDEKTRYVIEKRVGKAPSQRFFSKNEKEILEDILKTVLPEINGKIKVIEILGNSVKKDDKKGVRLEKLPWRSEMYKKGVKSIDNEALDRYDKNVSKLKEEELEKLINDISKGRINKKIWDFPSDLFFREMMIDITSIYYSFPESWDEIKFAGPSYPRGYYKLGCDEREGFEPEIKNIND